MIINGKIFHKTIKQLKAALGMRSPYSVAIKADGFHCTFIAGHETLCVQLSAMCSGDIDTSVMLSDLLRVPLWDVLDMQLKDEDNIGITNSNGDSLILRTANRPGPDAVVTKEGMHTTFIPAVELERMFSLAPFACQDMDRLPMHSVYIDHGCAAATDTHRLAIVPMESTKDINVLLDIDVVHSLRKILPNAYGGVELLTCAGSDMSIFRVPGTGIQLSGRTLGAYFPERYKNIAEDAQASSVSFLRINTAQLRNALGMVNLIADNQNRCAVTLDELGYTLTAKGIGAAIALKRQCEIVSGLEEFPQGIGFKCRYMMQGCQFLGAGDCEAMFSAVDKCILFRRGDVKYMLMPTVKEN